ncbi:MAG: hypothetical protein WAN86_23500, partial [Hyphomicrobiaceae bacterium]
LVPQRRSFYLIEFVFAVAIAGIVGMWYGRTLERREFERLVARLDDGCYARLKSAAEGIKEIEGGRKDAAPDR